MILDIVIMLGTGVVAGVLSGLFGLGGGIVVVPILVLFFKLHAASLATDMHLAVGTSLAVMIVTTFNAIWNHYRAGNIIWDVVKRFLPLVLVGAICGTVLAHFVHASWLRYFFMLFLLFIIVQALFKKGFTRDCAMSDFKYPSKRNAGIVGALVGFLAVLLGIGGSVIMVPYLRKCMAPMKTASAIAVTITPAVSIVGAIGYVVIGFINPPHFHDTFGYLYIPAFIGVSIGTLVGVPVGVRLTSLIPDALLAKIYILLLVVFLVMMAV